MKIFLLLFVFGAMAESQSPGAKLSKSDRFVSIDGSDQNDGSAGRPWRTIQHAAEAVDAGATVYVLPGSYNVSETIMTTRSGTETARIRFVSKVKWGAKIRSKMGMPSMTWRNNGDFVDIVGFDVSGDGNEGIINYGSHVRIIGNHVHDYPPTFCDLRSPTAAGINSGANYQASDNDVIGNVVHDIGEPGYITMSGPNTGKLCNVGQGIYHANRGGLISNNIAYRNTAYGLALWHSATANIVSNNLFFDNGGRDRNGNCAGGGIYAGSEESGAKNPTATVWADSQVNNNILYQNACYALRLAGRVGKNNQFIKNLSFRNARSDSFVLANGNIETETIHADPQFENPTGDFFTGDYRIRPSSPALGSGTHAGAPADDFDGKPRKGAIDVGPYQSSATVTVIRRGRERLTGIRDRTEW
jgi:parallel beta-helix repeat protein